MLFGFLEEEEREEREEEACEETVEDCGVGFCWEDCVDVDVFVGGRRGEGM